MITDPQLMPDFRDSLEQALYRRASEPALAPARRLPRMVPRPTLAGRLALGATALVAAIAVVFTALPGHKASHRAFAEPLILSQPTQPVPDGLSAGVLVKTWLGANAEFQRSIPLNVFGKRAYLLQAQAGWCLIPVIGSGSSTLDFGQVACETNVRLMRLGMAVVTGGTYIAVIPPGAEPPTLQPVTGPARALAVSDLGVVAVTGLNPGDSIVRHGLDGTVRTDTVN